jgi:hypothetical protein
LSLSQEQHMTAANVTSFRIPGLTGVCAALLPPERGGPDPRQVAGQVESYAARLPIEARHGLRAGVAMLNMTSVVSTGHTLLRNGPDERARALSRLERHPTTSQALEGVKALVLLVYGAHRHGGELLTRWQAVPPVRPDAELNVTSSAWWPSRSSCDAVVIGSGAGGAMAARTLARAGLDVLVVEEGRRFTVDEFRHRHPIDRFAALYRDGGATAALGRPPVVLPIGRGVGGTTLVNSGTCYRPPAKVVRAWRDEAGLALADPDVLSPYLDEVEATIRVAPVSLDVMGCNGKLMLDGAKRLGWASAPIPHNGSGCAGCCQSAIGCPVNAKFGVHLNALPQACESGARIVSEARVIRILHERGRATGVRIRRPDGTLLEVRAPRVVVAAGATETPPLLRRSGLGGHHELGRNLSVHPSVAISGRFEQPVNAWDGVLQSAAIEEFHDSDGILVEATSTPPGMGSMAYPGVGAALLARLDDADHYAQLGAMVADLPVGRVLGARRALIRYDLSDRDGLRLLKAIEIMGKTLFAAGATEVLPMILGHHSVTNEAELADAVRGADVRGLHIAAFHPTGTARAGRDPERSPVDGEGRLRGVRGVWVADASIVPTCPEVNPQVSIMALALAVADRIVVAG